MSGKDKSAIDLGGTLYCAGCNERFHRASGSAACPRCGADVRQVSQLPLDETLLIRDVWQSGDLEPTIGPIPDEAEKHALHGSAACDELDRLLGNDLGVYHCESLLGCGGMGRVYLAHHRDLQRMCALKVLSPKLAKNDVDYVARFRQEARAAAALVHRNIVTAHAIGDDRGFHFLEMEFVAGRSLQQLIEDEGRLTPVRATALAAQIAEGLSAAHRANIVHRDLKPDNVLLTRRGVPKIADFGLAKRILSEEGVPAARLAGTPNFMAPELYDGRPAKPSSDVYALGVCYFLLLTGRLPFVCGTLQELMRRVHTEPLPNVRDEYDDVSLEMAECLSLLMAKTPENRPRDGIEAAELLRAVLGQVRDIESLLAEVFRDDDNVTWTRTGGRYRLALTRPDGRNQVVFVETSDNSPAERLLLIYSVCCNAQPDYYEQALRLNSEIPHGALAIREIEGESKFVMLDTYPRATVDPEEIHHSVLEVAYRADDVEKLLTGVDNY